MVSVVCHKKTVKGSFGVTTRKIERKSVINWFLRFQFEIVTSHFELEPRKTNLLNLSGRRDLHRVSTCRYIYMYTHFKEPLKRVVAGVRVGPHSTLPSIEAVARAAENSWEVH